MGGDYTRVRFDPVKQFSGVRTQQGRVSLDSDFNEFEAILDRRRRAQMYDTVGRAVVPKTTPNGFMIGVSGGHLTIGIGRAYVDGILAECFGDLSDAARTVRDDVLGGVVGAGPLPFAKQPFVYTRQPGLAHSTPFPGLQDKNDIQTVYLDVWQREVTVWEDDDLREPALNGPDTATRVQTAWQVKVMKTPAKSSDCAATPEGWNALVAPSTGRLSTKATGALTPPPGPCEILPAGGYTGLENRLYRVEVHQTGSLGGGGTKAQFKWSRDNASLAARVTAIAKGAGGAWTITVSSTGPDSWTRFDTDDHLELVDDDVEFAMRETGTGGLMMKVVNVDQVNGVITVDQDLSAWVLRADRHPRVRRWDTASATEALVRDAVATIALENGISITFDGAPTDRLHAGDYWVFAARTVDGSIETLVNAPPRGVLHHFAKLALVTVGKSAHSDCRIFWPPSFGGGTGESCCTAVVKPGESIQSAIDSLAATGGCVCLKNGTHDISEPLRIEHPNITLHAEAPWTTVRRTASESPLMLEIQSTSHVNVCGIRFEAASGAKGGPLATLEAVQYGRIVGCAFGFLAAAQPDWDTIGVRLADCNDCAIEDNSVGGIARGITGEEIDRLRIEGNLLTALTVSGADGVSSAGMIGISIRDVEGLAVERNLLTDFRRGIQVGDLTTGTQPLDVGAAGPGCRIADNIVMRRSAGAAAGTGAPSSDDGLFAMQTGTSKEGFLLFAIAARLPRCEIVENAVLMSAVGEGGILAASGDVLISRNVVESTATFDSGDELLEIPRGVVALGMKGEPIVCGVRDNMFRGLQQAVFASGPDTADASHRVDVLSNTIVGDRAFYARLVEGLRDAKRVGDLIEYAALFGAIGLRNLALCRVAGNGISSAIAGVLAIDVAAARVTENTFADSLAGVCVAIATECEISDNTLDRAVAGVVLLLTKRTAVRRNVITLANLGQVGILDFGGTNGRVEDNDVYGGANGIELLGTTNAEVRGNNVQGASGHGIASIVALQQITLSHNRVLRCGYRRNADVSSDAAIGIVVMMTEATAIVDACQALDTGESVDASSSQASPFEGPRIGILVQAPRARVHHCVVTSPSIAEADGGPGAHADSRALLLGGATAGKGGSKTNMTIDVKGEQTSVELDHASSVEASDNLAEQTATIVVEVFAGETIFSSNRCALVGGDDPGEPIVQIISVDLVATGNRVQSVGEGPSLQLVGTAALTAVANISTGGAHVAAPKMEPKPYPAFNVKG